MLADHVSRSLVVMVQRRVPDDGVRRRPGSIIWMSPPPAELRAGVGDRRFKGMHKIHRRRNPDTEQEDDSYRFATDGPVGK